MRKEKTGWTDGQKDGLKEVCVMINSHVFAFRWLPLNKITTPPPHPHRYRDDSEPHRCERRGGEHPRGHTVRGVPPDQTVFAATLNENKVGASCAEYGSRRRRGRRLHGEHKHTKVTPSRHRNFIQPGSEKKKSFP